MKTISLLALIAPASAAGCLCRDGKTSDQSCCASPDGECKACECPKSLESCTRMDKYGPSYIGFASCGGCYCDETAKVESTGLPYGFHSQGTTSCYGPACCTASGIKAGAVTSAGAAPTAAKPVLQKTEKEAAAEQKAAQEKEKEALAKLKKARAELAAKNKIAQELKEAEELKRAWAAHEAEPTCVKVTVGSNSVGGPKSSSLKQSYVCPDTVDKSNWKGGHTYGDYFKVDRRGDEVRVTRGDIAGHSWGMNLEFECCKDKHCEPDNCVRWSCADWCKCYDASKMAIYNSHTECQDDDNDDGCDCSQ